MGHARQIAAALALCAAAAPALAQESLASTEAPAVSDASELSAVERWEMDPGVFLDAADVTLADFLYIARPVIVFADSPNDPRFAEQVAMLEADLGQLVVRDVVVILDSDPSAESDARAQLRPRGFGIVLISKDGRIAQRKPDPFTVREIGRAIDKMPLRQQEIREGG
ncbi:DUF4174 domain-containing protein [Wenxinia saemankumensis]|uniref:DUF4174 domain-containing protein n=1 Tax=Wenxinia saemankumensis TaxID=1447782 RepID=A0A1M6AQ91_9RHOB|nr:DUF4174 domain-containing protein [Wenxinia saemankumensis]SHI38632.1 protein of unknown function [Wenxinia saemankumensis]